MTSETRIRSSKGLLISLAAMVALALAAGGYWFYHQEVRTIRSEKYNELKVIAELKVGQIVAWRNVCLTDARMNSSGIVRMYVLQWLKTPDDMALRAAIQSRLQVFRKVEGYQDMILAAPDGRLLLSLDPSLTELEADTKQLTAQAVASGKAVFGDFFRCLPCNQIHLEIAAPILDDEQRPVAVLVLRSDPETILYPLIQSWPLPSQSAETLLMRKDGNDALFLNVLRHRPDPALTIRIPLSRADVPVCQAVLGKTGVFEGQDYRGVDVLADLRPVPGSPWFLVAKVDTSEIFADARYHSGVILLLVVLGMVIVILMAAYVGSYQRKKLYQNLKQMEQKLKERIKELHCLYSIAAMVEKETVLEKILQKTAGLIPSGYHYSEVAVVRIVLGKQEFKTGNFQETAWKQSADIIVHGQPAGAVEVCYLEEEPDRDEGSFLKEERNLLDTIAEQLGKVIERKKVEEALASQSELLKNVISNIPDYIFWKDKNSIYLGCNDNFAKMASVEKPEDIVGKSDYDLPWKKEESDSYRKIDKEVMGKGQLILNIEEPLHQADGKEGVMLTSKVPLRNAAGEIFGSLGIFIDITERKRAETELQRSMQNLQNLKDIISRSPVLVFIWRIIPGEWPVEFVSDNVCKVLGYTADDFISGRVSWVGITHPDDVPKLESEVARYLASGKREWSQEYRIITKSGAILWFRDQNMALADPQGNLIHIQSVIIDITERKLMEETLRASERNLAMTLKSIGDAVIATDCRGRIVRMNQVAEQLTGWALGESQGRLLSEVFHIINQQSRQRVENPVAKVLETGNIQGLANDTVLVSRQGLERIIADSAAAIVDDDTGQNVGVVLVFRDQTHEYEMQTALKFKNIMLTTQQEVSIDGILVVDEQGKIISFNRRFADIWGIPDDILASQSDERALKFVFAKLVNPEEFFKRVVYLYEHKQEKNREEIGLKDGRTFDRYSAPMFGKEDKYYGRVWFFRDITERKQAEKAIRTLNATLEQRVTERTTELEAFAYSISHDLRAPLRAIDSFARIISESDPTSLGEDGRHCLQAIQNNCQQMDRLIEGLLTFSRLSQQPLKKQKIELHGLVNSVLKDFQAQRKGRHIKIMLGTLPDCEADPILLRQVWFNLLSNAIKFTRQQKEARIEIGYQQQETQSVYFIKDNGVGFDMRYAHKLFNVFQRLHRAEDYEGTGVGLAVVQRIILRHGGRVWIESAPDQGTTIYFTL